MQLALYIALFLAGLVIIIKGADWLTDGAADIAHRMGIPTIVVGLTVVAMGSSMPEFVVSFLSALNGQTGMAVGNVVGSNIFNVLGILGITALVRPIVVNRSSIRNDVPFAVLAAVVGLIAVWNGVVEQTDGLMMLCIFAVFMSYTLAIGGGEKAEEPEEEKPQGSVWKTIGMTLLGLVGLILGGEMLVEGGANAARLVGVPESLVALTFISIGTSSPELAASIMAARKGDHGIALGNIVGSCVFNMFFVLGASAAVCPLEQGGVTMVDFGVLLFSSVLLWLFCRFGDKKNYRLNRVEGAIFILIAVAYYAWLIISPQIQQQ